MSSSKLFVALLAAAKLAYAGQSVIHNSCQGDVFYMVSGAEGIAPTTERLAPGGQFAMEYKNLNGAGVAIFLSNVENDITDYTQSSSLTRLEITYQTNTVWYDVSNIDQQQTGVPTSNYPFIKWGFSLLNSACSGSFNCAPAVCPPGPCEHAYDYSSDDQTSMRDGSPENDIILHLCNPSGDQPGYKLPTAPNNESTGSDSGSDSGSSSSSSSSSTNSPAASPASNEYTPDFDDAGKPVVVTSVATAVATEVVTAAPKHRRHEHRHRHAHHAE